MSVDTIGAKINYDAAVRRNYKAVDQTKCRRIAKQLIDGRHLETYGFESARNVVLAAADQVTRAVIIRPSAKVVKYQKANCTIVIKQNRIISAVATATNQAHNLHEAKKKISLLEAELVNATSRKHRRNINFMLHALRSSV